MHWDSRDWLTRYRTKLSNRERLHALRAEVFQSSVHTLSEGGYETRSGRVDLAHREATWAGTVFYEDTADIPVADEARDRYVTKVAVVGGDTLDTAHVLIVAGGSPAVLNMANASNPGGGVLHGAGAQEENLFRRTTLPWSLYQFAPYHGQYGVAANPEGKRYPIPADAGAIYSPHIVAFRSSEATGYGLLDRPYELAVVTVAAIDRPTTITAGEEVRLSPGSVSHTLPRVRAILRVAARHGHPDLVLGAFGCGAFHNPPRHMAELFRETLSEPEFGGVFRSVVFAIFDRAIDLDSKLGGNLLPFREVFGV